MVVLQVKLRNGDSYLTQIDAALEEAEKYIWAQKFIKLMYQGALVFVNTDDIVSIALQEVREDTKPASFEEVLDKQ